MRRRYLHNENAIQSQHRATAQRRLQLALHHLHGQGGGGAQIEFSRRCTTIPRPEEAASCRRQCLDQDIVFIAQPDFVLVEFHTDEITLGLSRLVLAQVIDEVDISISASVYHRVNDSSVNGSKK